MIRIARIKRVPYAIWNSMHTVTHVCIGLVFAWFLRELWGEFSLKYTILAVAGSLVMDLDHFIYYFVYGRNELYAIQTRKFLRQGQFGTVIRFWKDNHKQNTGLLSHNIYFLALLTLLTLISFITDWRSRTVIFGAMSLHLAYDAFDDLLMLGHLNENWKRLRRKKGNAEKVLEYIQNLQKKR